MIVSGHKSVLREILKKNIISPDVEAIVEAIDKEVIAPIFKAYNVERKEIQRGHVYLPPNAEYKYYLSVWLDRQMLPIVERVTGDVYLFDSPEAAYDFYKERYLKETTVYQITPVYVNPK